MNHKRGINRADVMDLLSKRFAGGALSVYLGFPPDQRRDGQNWSSVVHSGLKELTQHRPADPGLSRLIETAEVELQQLPVDVRHRNLVYLRSLDPAWTFWRSLQMPVKPAFVFDQALYVRPLVALLEKAPVMGVGILSKKHVRVFTWKDGQVEESPEIVPEPEEEEMVGAAVIPAPSRGNGESTAASETARMKPQPRMRPGRREDQARRLQRRAALRLGELGQQQGWQNLLLVGPAPAVAVVASDLQDRWKRLLIDPLDRNLIKAPLSEIAESVTRQVREWKQRTALKEIDSLVEQSLARGRSCTRVEHCLGYLNERRVERLYLRGDLRLSGYRDSKGNLYLNPPEDLSEPLVPEPRLVERMIGAAMESGAEVVLLEGEAAERLGLLGGVGGRLRWKNSSNGHATEGSESEEEGTNSAEDAREEPAKASSEG